MVSATKPLATRQVSKSEPHLTHQARRLILSGKGTPSTTDASLKMASQYSSNSNRLVRGYFVSHLARSIMPHSSA